MVCQTTDEAPKWLLRRWLNVGDESACSWRDENLRSLVQIYMGTQISLIRLMSQSLDGLLSSMRFVPFPCVLAISSKQN